jgi:hypothetical protein
MPAPNNQRANLNKVMAAAEEQGYQVSEVPKGDGRIALDITRDPDMYQFEAYFSRDRYTGFWAWDIGYQHRDGGADKIHTMARFIERLPDAKPE